MAEKAKFDPRHVIVVAAFAAFLATFNETYLNVAFPPIMADLGVDVGTVQWLATAYMLGATVMVPVSAFKSAWSFVVEQGNADFEATES